MNQPVPLLPLSNRTVHLREASILRALTLKVQAYDDGINLGQGVCDLEMPRPLRLGAVEALFQDRATYTNYRGLITLRQEISRRMQARYGLVYDTEDIVVTVGSSMAYTATLMTLLDPGDEVVLMEPFYPYHYTGALLAGAVVKTVPVDLGHDGIPWDALEMAISRRTKILVLNTPSNPLGRVWVESEYQRLAQILRLSGAYLVTDEIYEDLVYEGGRHLPPATHPPLKNRTITISGLSKAYSITGWRLGWLAAPPALSHAIGPVFDVLAVCAARPLQAAAATAMRELPESYYLDLRDGYERRRKVLCDALDRSGFKSRRPMGAYYVLADYRERYGSITPMEACERLLAECHIAAIPSTIFYAHSAPTELRFQFAVQDSVLSEVARRLTRRVKS
jgi:aminotransferase